jgi:serine/threonine protein kinase
MSESSSQKPVPAAPPGSSSAARMNAGEGSAPPMADGQITVISARPPVANLAFASGVPPLESGSLLEGEQLGQFLLQKFVGGGGMGIVFRALDTTLNREVAVKVLSRDQSTDEEALRRFRNEAQSAARLNHDNIARVHYVGEDRGVHYIVFEFIEGVNIRDLVEQKGPLPLEEAVSYTFQIALALEHASQRAVIHRDIKPSNVLITPDGKAKLVDMGLARLNQVAQTTNDLTASGVTLGTFDYISPEQARDPRSADVRSDMYSLGCSFFYMLTGRPPFPDGTVLQKLLQHQGDHPPDPRSVRPELPVEVTRILAWLLAKNPAQRYQQPGELIDDLAALGEKLGMQLNASRAVWAAPRPDGPIARWQHHLPWVVPLAALLLIFVALDFYWSSAPSETTFAASSPAAKNRPLPSPRNATAQAGNPTAPSQRDPRAKSGDLFGPSTNTVTKNAPPDPQPQEPAPTAELSQSPPPPSFPWWQQLSKGWQASLNLEQLSARASAAANTSSHAAAPPAGSPEELGVSAADSTVGPQRAPFPGKPATNLEHLLIVGDEGGPHTYASLNAACSDAKNGDTIELRFNGRRPEKPIVISNTRLTIRAGDRYQPVIVFQPEPELIPVKYPPTMLSVSGGQLRVNNVHWELDLPRNVPADWALFEIRRCELVQFQNCTFTVRGQATYHAGVAFFDIKAPPGTGTMAMDPNAMEDQIVTIHLQNCLARGEATFLRSNELQAVRLNWDNGLLATSERLLIASGGPSQPRQVGHVQINLRHVTAMLQNGLALLTNSEDAPYQLLTEIHCDDSIFASSTKPPLIEQRGSDRVEEFVGRLQWSGDRDFFDGFDVFWQIANTSQDIGSKQQHFEEWQSFWAAQSRAQVAGKNAVLWRRLPSADRAFHAHAPADYALNTEIANNPAFRAASDGLDAGCVARQLPALPSEERGDVPSNVRNIGVP